MALQSELFTSPHAAEAVVLLDGRGAPSGLAPKTTVHDRETPLHLGFSCYIVRSVDEVLLTRRASSKATWPSTWSNSCCGHPLPGETLRTAVRRRLRDELGVDAHAMALALPDFAYRAVMANGTVEHELCPVVVVELDDAPTPNPDEVEDTAWIEWTELLVRAREAPDSLSPWSVRQIAALEELAVSPRELLAQAGASALLDRPAAEVGFATPNSRSAVDPFAVVRHSVEPLLSRFLSNRTAEVDALDPALTSVTSEIRGLVAAPSKRLRPVFTYWGYRAAGGTDDAAVVPAAAALELLHAFALLHDDVMDRSAMRRGRPAAAQAFARAHRRDAMRGDAGWFGTSAAILAGDLTFAWADELFEESPGSPDAMKRARRVFSALRAEVMAGQYLDLRLAALSRATETAARKVALLKSGRYTVTRPLQVGSALATAHPDPPLARALATFGDAIGFAFQLRDDVLGLFGDPNATGKPTLDDLRDGKRTLLVLRALSLAERADHQFLRAAVGDPRLEDAAADRCRTIIERSGARASIEALIRAQHAIALDALLDVPQPARDALEQLASLTIDRTR